MSKIQTPLSIARLRIRPHRLSCRTAYFIIHTRLSTSWPAAASPPRLPKEEQEIFEELQRRSTGAFSNPRADSDASGSDGRPEERQSPQESFKTQSQSDGASETSHLDAKVDATGKGDELHPNVRRGAPPEFEGETNPATGEVGGPKVEPLRWGSGGDYSYNGRVTDF
jgi:hypothetical protein